MFVWKPGTYREKIPYRYNLNRPAQDIPQAEMLGLIGEHPGVLSSVDPAKELSALMGQERLEADTRSYLDACIEIYKQHLNKDKFL